MVVGSIMLFMSRINPYSIALLSIVLSASDQVIQGGFGVFRRFGVLS